MFIDLPEDESPVSENKTPYAVTCYYERCKNGELIYLTNKEYMRQMRNAHNRWECPLCGGHASWNDDNYESFFEVDNKE